MQNRYGISLSRYVSIGWTKIADVSPHRFCVSPLIRPAYGGPPSPRGRHFVQQIPIRRGEQIPAAFSQFRFNFLVVRKYMMKYPPTMVTTDRISIVPMTLRVLFSAPLPTRTVTSMIVHTRLMP